MKYLKKDIYDNLEHEEQRIAYIMLVSIVEFGGMFVDTDWHCYKPFSEFNYKYQFFTGLLINLENFERLRLSINL